MEGVRKENATNENTNFQADTLIDLAVADEQADETKGGPSDASDYVTWRKNFGSGL